MANFCCNPVLPGRAETCTAHGPGPRALHPARMFRHEFRNRSTPPPEGAYAAHPARNSFDGPRDRRPSPEEVSRVIRETRELCEQIADTVARHPAPFEFSGHAEMAGDAGEPRRTRRTATRGPRPRHPTQRISEVMMAQAATCPVCLEDYKLGQVVRRLPCMHFFHKRCIDQWLQRHGTCPTCRQPA